MIELLHIADLLLDPFLPAAPTCRTPRVDRFARDLQTVVLVDCQVDDTERS